MPSIALALLLAVSLQQSSRFNTWLRTIFFFPVLLTLVAAASLFLFVFMPRVGLIDYHLASWGLAETNRLGDPDIALYAIIGLTVWKNTGYYMLFPRRPAGHTGGILRGCNPGWRQIRFWQITSPLLSPTISFVVAIALINSFVQDDHVVVLTKGGPSDSTNILLNYIFQGAHEQQDIGRSAAATVVSVGTLLVLSIGAARAIERGAAIET